MEETGHKNVCEDTKITHYEVKLRESKFKEAAKF